MAVVRLLVEYDGTDYHGWQRQPTAATIQGTLEAAIRRISGEQVALVGAGRTDAGVHAAGQVAHFHSRSAMPPEVWRRALNAVLPPDVKILEAAEAPETFHARFSAARKRYRYRVLNRPVPSPLERRTSWHVPRPLNLAAMRRACAALVGRHDFRAFEGADPSHGASHRTVCAVTACSVRRRGDIVSVDIECDRFLKYMVRNIVGTLVEVGLGRRPASDMDRILRSRDRGQAGVTAPAHGLTLMEVRYDENARR